MLLADFLRHTTKCNCEHKPLEGINITGMALKINNKAIIKGVYYLHLYKGGEIPDKTVIEACDKLFIKCPDYLVNS